MKRTLLLILLGVSLACPAWGQTDSNNATTTTNPHPDGPQFGRHFDPLTPEERQELQKAHDEAFEADPSLATDQQELNEQQKALQRKIYDAMIKADPNVATILEKLEAAKHRDHDGDADDHPPRPPGDGLTPEEKQELKAAHDAAFQADPSLATEEQNLRQQIEAARESGQPPDPSLKAQMQALQQKIHEAMLKADPNIAQIMGKMQGQGRWHRDFDHDGDRGGDHDGSEPSQPSTGGHTAPSKG